MNINWKSLIRWETALVFVLILELVVFGAIEPRFVDPARLLRSMSDFVYLGIAAMPLAMIMITGGIDISFGSIASLSAIVAGVIFVNSGNMAVGLIAGIAVGLLCGIVNGLFITTTKSIPMVITLGTQFLFAGLALGVSGLGGVSSFEGISGLPDWFNEISNGKLFGVPNLLIIFLIFAAAFWFLMSRTTFGRKIYLYGMNPRAAAYAGFRINKLLISAYAGMGLVAGVVGLLLTSYVGSARADMGGSLLMPVLTLVVIGGISMNGGEGSLLGVVIATFVIGFLQQGLRFTGLNENEVAVVTGGVLILVASLRWWSTRGSEAMKNRRVKKQINKKFAERSATAPVVS